MSSDQITVNQKYIPQAVKDQLNKWMELTNYAASGPVNGDKIDKLFMLMELEGYDYGSESHNFPIEKMETPSGSEEKAEDLRIKIEEVLVEQNLYFLHTKKMRLLFFNESTILGNITIGESSTSLMMVIRGSKEFSKHLMAIIKNRFEGDRVHIVEDLRLSPNHGIVSVTNTLPVGHPGDVDCFYPYFDKTIKQWWGEFSRSKSNLALFIGKRGTGKSNFIKACIDARSECQSNNVYLCSDEHVITHESLSSYIKELPTGSLFVIEDADRLLGKREEGNDQMASILNALSGIISTNVKFIITTNRPNLKMVDEALLRPGRTHSILEFKDLTPEQANTARKETGYEAVDFNTDKITLAQALNWNEGNVSQHLVQGVGF